MTLLADIGLYIVFLVEWAAFSFLMGKLVKRIQADPTRGLSLGFQQLMIVLSILQIGLTLLLLARVFSLVLLGLLLAAYELGVLLALIVRAILGMGYASIWLFGVELGASKRIVVLGPAALGIIVALGYPIAAGVAYFTLDKGSDELLFWIVVLTAATVLAGVVQQLALSIAMLVNPYLGESARTQTLIGQLTNIPQPALWVAIAFWASAEEEGGVAEGNRREFALVLIVLIGLIISLTVLPYLIGAYRARTSRTRLLSRELDWWKRLAETAEIPIRTGYPGELRALDEELRQEREAFKSEHETFLNVNEMLHDRAARAELESAGFGFPSDAEIEEISRSDPRMRFVKNLNRVESAADELLVAAEGEDSAASRELAGEWAQSARRRGDEAEKAAAAVKEAPTGRAALGFVFAPVFGVVFDQFGRLIWEELSTLTG